jgi:hypothetical protein
LGWHARGFNGAEPLSWQEIKAWSDMTRNELAGWEATALRLMSQSYCNWQYRTSADKDIDPPILPPEEVIAEIQAINAKRFKAMMKASV